MIYSYHILTLYSVEHLVIPASGFYLPEKHGERDSNNCPGFSLSLFGQRIEWPSGSVVWRFIIQQFRWIEIHLVEGVRGIAQLEKLPNRQCPRCGQMNLNIYFSNDEDEKLGAWCESCNLRAYYNGNELVSMN